MQLEEQFYLDSLDPTLQVNQWELTDAEQLIFDAGYAIGYNARQPELDQANHDADRYYRIAYDRDHHGPRR